MISTLKKYRLLILELSLLSTLTFILLAPETFLERMDPWDGALFAANGAFFLSLFHELPSVISSPGDWVWDYYNQYPALSIRRHPPIFGIVESALFAIFDVSAVTAKLAVLLSSILMIIAWFLALRKIIKDEFVAFFSAVLLLSMPMSVSLGTAVLPDTLAIMFVAWGYYFYGCDLDFNGKTYKYAILISISLACAIYTYQFSMFGGFALLLYMIFADWKNPTKRLSSTAASILFVALMLPLGVFTFKYAPGNLGGVGIEVPEEYMPYVPVKSILRSENWIFYLEALWKHFPVLSIGLIIWGLTKVRVRPKKYELLFLLWFLIGWFGCSMIPQKHERYAYHFLIAALPLIIIGIRDILKLFPALWISKRHVNKYATALITIILVWNFSRISITKATSVTDMDASVSDIDKVPHWILSEHAAGNILYDGAYESAFIFYTRKYDADRKFRVFRTGKDLNQPDKIIEDIRRNNISIVVSESEHLRPHWGRMYDLLYDNMNAIIDQGVFLTHLRDFPVSSADPKDGEQALLRVYKVNDYE